jgi:hypothetical protein
MSKQMPRDAGGTGFQPLIRQRFRERLASPLRKNPVTRDASLVAWQMD